MMRCFRKKVLAVITVIAMLMVTVPFGAIATEVLGESIGLIEIPLAPSNMTISKEVAMFDSVIDNLWTAREKLYDNPAVVGAPYVPVGATCLEVYSVGNVVYVNYVMNNTYYYTTYYKNTGEVEKVARVKNSDDIYSVSTASTTASVVRNLDEWRSTYTYSRETESFVLVEESIGRQNMNERTVVRSMIVPIDSRHVIEGWNSIIVSGTIDIPELELEPNYPNGDNTAIEYAIVRDPQVYSEPNHVINYYEWQDFPSGTPVSQIANAFGASVHHIRYELQLVGVGINSSDCITQFVQIVESGVEFFEANILCAMRTPNLDVEDYVESYDYEYVDCSSDLPVGRWDLDWTDPSDTGLGFNEPVWVQTCEFYDYVASNYLFQDHIRDWSKDFYIVYVQNNGVGAYDPFFFDDL